MLKAIPIASIKNSEDAMDKAKSALVCLLLCLMAFIADAQSLIDGPESVIFDEARNRYLVSNWMGGSIVEIDSLGGQKYFAGDVTRSAGLCISGDTLWAAANNPNRVLAFDLNTGENLINVTIYGSVFFDSIELDSSGFVYITDSNNPNPGGRIFRLKISDLSYIVYYDTGISRPQTMRFLPDENALIFCTADTPGKIQKLNLTDSTLATVTTCSIATGFDGITFDNYGNVYLSSWTFEGIFRYDSLFTEPPVQIRTGISGPTSLYYNRRDNILAAPNFYSTEINFFQMYLTVETDSTIGWAPFEVNFSGASDLSIVSWNWDFGDGGTSALQSPSHTFNQGGIHNVTLQVDTGDETLERSLHIFVLADTLIAPEVMITPGNSYEVEIYARNSIPLNMIQVPIEYAGTLPLTYDSFSTAGCRTEYFDQQIIVNNDPSNKRAAFRLYNADDTPDLEPGSGSVLKIYFSVPISAQPGQEAPIIIDGYNDKVPFFYGHYLDLYNPFTIDGDFVSFKCGDANSNYTVNLLDITYLIDFLYKGGASPVPYAAGDVDASGIVNILDITYLINFLYKGGPAPNCG